jgi:hypothetical protein
LAFARRELRLEQDYADLGVASLATGLTPAAQRTDAADQAKTQQGVSALISNRPQSLSSKKRPPFAKRG